MAISLPELSPQRSPSPQLSLSPQLLLSLSCLGLLFVWFRLIGPKSHPSQVYLSGPDATSGPDSGVIGSNPYSGWLRVGSNRLVVETRAEQRVLDTNNDCAIKLDGEVSRLTWHRTSGRIAPFVEETTYGFTALVNGAIVVPKHSVTNHAGLTTFSPPDSWHALLDNTAPTRPVTLRGCTPHGRLDEEGTLWLGQADQRLLLCAGTLAKASVILSLAC